MKQSPSNLKFSKYHSIKKSIFVSWDHSSFLLSKGFYGMKALQSGKLKFTHMEAARRTLRSVTKKNGEMFMNVFTNFSVTKKSSGSRMGRGKGAHSFWICSVKKGQVLYELNCMSHLVALKALKSASGKLPVKVSIVSQEY